MGNNNASLAINKGEVINYTYKHNENSIFNNLLYIDPNSLYSHVHYIYEVTCEEAKKRKGHGTIKYEINDTRYVFRGIINEYDIELDDNSILETKYYVYKGEMKKWHNDFHFIHTLPHGYGTLTFRNGNEKKTIFGKIKSIEGNFVKGVAHGLSRCIFEGGMPMMILWANGTLMKDADPNNDKDF